MMFALTQPRLPVWGLPVALPTGGRRGAIALTKALVSSWFGGSGARRTDAVMAARSGDFDAVVLPHLGPAYNLARYLTRDADAAEDLVQDAMLKAHRAFAGYRGGDAKAWLLTIVRREFIDWANARRAGRAVFSETDAAEVEESASSGEPTPEEAVLRQGEIGAVRRAIETLAEPFREAIILRELEELSYRQVAEITGVPIGTVMSRLARARQMLARRLDPAAERQWETLP